MMPEPGRRHLLVGNKLLRASDLVDGSERWTAHVPGPGPWVQGFDVKTGSPWLTEMKLMW